MHHIPYILNIAILAPVVWALIRMSDGESSTVFVGSTDAPVLRFMVASLWGGVMIISAIALVNPVLFWPLLMFQVVYKLLFIVLWCLPIWLGYTSGAVPGGPVSVFIFIIVVWPFFIVMALQSGQT